MDNNNNKTTFYISFNYDLTKIHFKEHQMLVVYLSSFINMGNNNKKKCFYLYCLSSLHYFLLKQTTSTISSNSCSFFRSYCYLH